MAKGHSQNPFQPSSNHKFNLFWQNHGDVISAALGKGDGADRLLEEMYCLNIDSMKDVRAFLLLRLRQVVNALQDLSEAK